MINEGPPRLLIPLLPEMPENRGKCERVISAHNGEDNQSIRPAVSDGKITITGSQSAMFFDKLDWRHSKKPP